MINRALAALAVVLLFGTPPSTAKDNPDEAVLLKLARTWTQAYLEHDTKALDSMALGSFVSTFDGSVMNKKQYLDSAPQPGSGKITIEELRATVIGDTGVVLGRERIDAAINGKQYSGDFCFTATAVKRKGRWLALAIHENGIAEH